jgi:benzoyl-CoA-dihydrodiol lyase
MAEHATTTAKRTDFQTHPSQYRHWKLTVSGERAFLHLGVKEEEGQTPEYLLKQNSYDLGVDIELADALQRLRFEHPKVRVLVLSSSIPRIFCAGANIYMLGRSSHAFKVNFCKFTNETRLGIEDLSRGSGVRSAAALNGTAAGGGYELALACDEIYLVDDGNSAVSFPEVPLLGVLPGTGGLTRLMDKRHIRRDRADIFCTIAEGIKGKRAKEWNLVDAVYPKSTFDAKVDESTTALARSSSRKSDWAPVELPRIAPEETDSALLYEFVEVTFDHTARTANLKLKGPDKNHPLTPEAWNQGGAALWVLKAWRELDHALLLLRVDYPGINIVTLQTEGDASAMAALDQALYDHRENGYANELILHIARVLRRLDLTAKSFFALIEPGSVFVGTLLELALAADRSYMLMEGKNAIATSVMNGGIYPMSHGASRLEARFACDGSEAKTIASQAPKTYEPEDAESAGLITMALDDLDYEDEVRLAVEERASLSPDALTGMEASLRFPGAENCDSKIFGRLSAWQNWIFQRPNAVGPNGALTNYGKPTRPEFDYRRT